MTEGQRPHVAGNDALFLFGDMEHFFCIDAGAARVGEAVHLEQAADAVEGTLFVPVIQVKIVKESADSQRGLVCTQMQPMVQPAADQHHILAVLIGGNVPMLDELPHLLHLGVLIVFFQNGIKLFAFRNRKLHEQNFLSTQNMIQERSCTGLELPKFSASDGFVRLRVRSTRYCLPSPSSSSCASFALAEASSGYHWMRKKFSASTP